MFLVYKTQKLLVHSRLVDAVDAITKLKLMVY